MKRNRVKAAGFGLALVAGYLHGADPLPSGPPMPAPAAVRAGEPTPVSDTVWLPARSPNGPSAAPAMPPVVPAVPSPAEKNEGVKPASNPAPELPPTSIPLPSLPDISIPIAPPVSTPPAPLPALPMISPSKPEPLPEIPIATPMLQPVPDPLPSPRPAAPPIPKAKDLPEPAKPAQPELPTAPPELMVPAGVPVPGKHGTFGSPGVLISKDYPSIRDVLDDCGLSSLWHRSEGEAPAAMAPDRLEVRAEYLLWWANSQRIPVLATTSVNGGFGFLGDPGTQTLLGPGAFGNSPRSGFRARAGYWFDECGTCGIDAGFFFLGKTTNGAAFGSDQFPTLTRPIFAPNFLSEFGEVVAYPGLSTGVLTIDASSTIWGFDTNIRKSLCKSCDFRSEVFAGYRFLALNESVTINEFVTALPGNPNDPPGTMVTVTDRFETRNRFNGGQVGYAAERIWGRWSVDGRASVALGNTSQTVEITGYQTRLRPGMTAPDTFSGGLLATGPNLGKFDQDRFSVVPEFTLNVGYWLTPVIKAYVGYNFLYWSNVVRAGDQIDRVVDVTFVPNPPPGVPFSGQYRPQPTFQQSNLSLNGIQFGIMGRW